MHLRCLIFLLIIVISFAQTLFGTNAIPSKNDTSTSSDSHKSNVASITQLNSSKENTVIMQQDLDNCFVQQADVKRLVHISLYGEHSKQFLHLINKLLGFPDLIDDSFFTHQYMPLDLLGIYNMTTVGNDGFIAVTDNSKRSDISICFLDKENILNEDLLLKKLAEAIDSLFKSDGFASYKGASEADDIKPQLIVLHRGNSLSTNLQETLWKSIQVAWSSTGRSKPVWDSLHINILLMPEDAFVSEEEREGRDLDSSFLIAMQKALQKAFNKKPFKSLDEWLNFSNSSESAVKAPLKRVSSDFIDADVLKHASTIALQRLLQQTNNSLVQLNRIEEPKEFSSFISHQLNSAIVFMKETLKAEKVIVTSSVEKAAREELSYSMAIRLQPIFDSKLNMLRRKALIEFQEIADDIEISEHIDSDFYALRSKVISSLQRQLQALRPSELLRSPSLWSFQGTLLTVAKILDDWIGSQIAVHQLSGVLSRELRPAVDISMHLFARHPFMRDYRQEVLGQDGDNFIVDDRLKGREINLVNPRVARSSLLKGLSAVKDQDKVSTEKTNDFQLRQQSEMAREMLMFPLSVKNPEVPMAGGRRTRKKSYSLTKLMSTNEREAYGPERFIRWDISPLTEVKVNLEELANKHSTPTKANFVSFKTTFTDQKLLNEMLETGVDQALNLIPHFNRGYYHHPAINYGVKYSPLS